MIGVNSIMFIVSKQWMTSLMAAIKQYSLDCCLQIKRSPISPIKMFKKPIKTAAQNQLSGKDKKHIKNKVAATFDEQCAQKLFVNNDKIICTKVSGSKMQIYLGEEYPLLVDGTGKDDYFPSLYVCAAYEPILNSIILNEGVEVYIFNGANLMWPGVKDYSDLGNFKKDEIVSIRSSKGEIIAVGAMGCSSGEMKDADNSTGVAVHIHHFRGDKLWEMGTKYYPQVIVKAREKKVQRKEVKVQTKIQTKVQQEPKKTKKNDQGEQAKPKESATKKVQNVKPKKVEQEQVKPKKVEKVQDSQSDDEEAFMNLVHDKKNNNQQVKAVKKVFFSDEEQNGKKKKKKPGKKPKKGDSSEEDVPHQVKEQKPHKDKEAKGKGKKIETPKEEPEEEERTQQSKKQKKNQKQKHKSSQDEQEQEEPKHKQSQDKSEEEHLDTGKSTLNCHYMNRYLKQAFLNAIKLNKIDAQLPIDSGRFYLDYMVLARPEGIKLDVKESSYKRLGIFYEEMAKQKFIEFKAAKEKKGQQGSTITKILWNSQELKEYVPTIKRMGERDLDDKHEEISKNKLKLTQTIQIEYVYRLSDELKRILLNKAPVNYMPSVEEEAQIEANKEKAKQQQVYLSEKALRDKIQIYINDIAKKEKKDDKKVDQKEHEEDKKEKIVILDYKDNEFINNLLKLEIEEYEESQAKEEMMMQADSDEEDKKKKKDKHRKNLFRADRTMLVNRIMDLAFPYYHMIDIETGLNKFKAGVFTGIQLISEKMINKNITKIIGVEIFTYPNVEPEQLVKQIHGFAQMLQVRYASSATVKNLLGKNAGNFLDELETLFVTQYGIRKDYIMVQNKISKKKKN